MATGSLLGDGGYERLVDVSWVMFDCDEPELLAEFWSKLIDVEISTRRGPFVFLERAASGLGLGFQRVAQPQDGKRRLHLDLVTDDPVSAVAFIEDLGGQIADGYESGGFLVMLDPEGNEFCVLPRSGARLDQEGTAHYQPRPDQLLRRSRSAG
jgi:predicted enzyme related to lactoylglutathione lyase